MRRWTWVSGVAAAGLMTALGLSATPAQDSPPSGVRIGLVKSLFRDVPAALIPIGLRPMKDLMVGQTGVNGDLVPAGDADSLARQLKGDEVQFAVFHGVEFAWVLPHYPTLKPLVIAVNEHPFLRALLVARKGGKITNDADLRGKVVNLTRGQEHCRLFLERHCCPAGEDPTAYFSAEDVQWCAEDALDGAVDDDARAAVVDETSLEAYRASKPGCAAKLKTLRQSELFPCAVVAYQPGALDQQTVQTFRDGLIGAKDSAKARGLLKANHMTGFEAPPADYEQMLHDIRNVYPPPDAR